MSYYGPGCSESWRWITYEDLIAASFRLARLLSGSGLEHIVAIARSGIIPGAIVSYHLHLPLWLYSPRSATIQWIGGGARMDSGLPYLDRKKAILIDDTIASGRTSAAAKAVTGIERLAVVYAAPEAINETDICAEVLPFPHLLEWNFWNSWYCPSIYCDIDGLCCPDPPLEVVGDKDRYLKWIEDVLPYDGPRKNPIAGFVTCRPRFAEAHTRRWLDKHGFRYQMLVMADSWITDLHAQAKWKASVLAALSARFYIESSEIMAELLRAELNRRGCLTLVSVPRRSAVYGEFSGWRA